MLRPAPPSRGNSRDALTARGGFTLIELLVVVAIIGILAAILVPVVTKIRTVARVSETQAFLQQLSASIEHYNEDFRSYPGPASNAEVYGILTPSFPAIAGLSFSQIPEVVAVFELDDSYRIDPAKGMRNRLTMSENLVLGLLGGLRPDPTTPGTIQYDPNLIGQGATSLNNLTPTGSVKKHKAYIEAKNLSWRKDPATGKQTGHFADAIDGAKDSIIPEFVDTFLDPMPILYMRAKRGASATGLLDNTNNTIVTYDTLNHANRVGQYDLHQTIAYTDTNIGEGRGTIAVAGWAPLTPTHGLTAVDPNATMTSAAPVGMTYKYPFDAYPYLRNTKLSTPPETAPGFSVLTSPRTDIPNQKDSFILISAGADRVYGTRDDITNFGQVGQ
jgi:prepilin-type N-terminal cleavage/methylation domain-containing protein